MMVDQQSLPRKLSKLPLRFLASCRCSIQLLTGWLLLTSGGWVIAFSTSADAQRRLPNYPTFDSLPPASDTQPVIFPQDTLPSVSPYTPNNQREYNFQAPSTPNRSRDFPARSLYRVDIYGDNPLLLTEVRRIEPEAFVRQNGVIQAGVFADQFNAQQRVRVLESQGIPAQINAIPANEPSFSSYTSEPFSIPSSRESVRVPDINTASRISSGYFVVIPGRFAELPNLTDRVVQLGARREAVLQREEPRGPHVALGPFGQKSEAERWNAYLRAQGLDARVYFDR